MEAETIQSPKPESIAQRAYLIWEMKGRPQGQHDAHWYQAEEQLKENAARDAGSTLRTEPPVLAHAVAAKHRHLSRRDKSKHAEAVGR